ncbi:MAG: nuclear transport factor 2 family protein [Candidatus Eisenbacteria bacterium]
MRSICCCLVFFTVVLALAAHSPAGERHGPNQALGEDLLRQVWRDIKNRDMAALDTRMSRGFQSVHGFGASDRTREMELIAGLDINQFSLSDIEITRNGPVITATYFVSVEETIDGERLSKEPAPRLTVFLETAEGWKWIAHANLKPMEQTAK